MIKTNLHSSKSTSSWWRREICCTCCRCRMTLAANHCSQSSLFQYTGHTIRFERRLDSPVDHPTFGAVPISFSAFLVFPNSTFHHWNLLAIVFPRRRNSLRAYFEKQSVSVSAQPSMVIPNPNICYGFKGSNLSVPQFNRDGPQALRWLGKPPSSSSSSLFDESKKSSTQARSGDSLGRLYGTREALYLCWHFGKEESKIC